MMKFLMMTDEWPFSDNIAMVFKVHGAWIFSIFQVLAYSSSEILGDFCVGTYAHWNGAMGDWHVKWITHITPLRMRCHPILMPPLFHPQNFKPS